MNKNLYLEEKFTGSLITLKNIIKTDEFISVEELFNRLNSFFKCCFEYYFNKHCIDFSIDIPNIKSKSLLVNSKDLYSENLLWIGNSYISKKEWEFLCNNKISLNSIVGVKIIVGLLAPCYIKYSKRLLNRDIDGHEITFYYTEDCLN